VVRFAGLTLDTGGRTLTDAEGREIVLRPAEFELLLTFVRHPGRALSRDELLSAAVGRLTEPFDRSIDVHVGRLRKKIEADRKCPRIIVTVPRFGYKMIADTEPERQVAVLGPSLRPGVDRRGPAALAVLPFATPEPDFVQQAVAMRLTESLIADLALSSRQPIIVGSVASRQMFWELGLRRLGDELSARYVVSGSVRRRGSALCICAQLTDTVRAAHLWTERATIEQDELGGAEDGVCRRVALTLARQLAIAEGIRAELAGESDMRRPSCLRQGDRSASAHSRGLPHRPLLLRTGAGGGRHVGRGDCLSGPESRACSPRTLEHSSGGRRDTGGRTA
jgi:TolB-like protein/DNA-binding winged helix-turn-helix (wHTH) protein